ncbi:purine-nucleoside phosphorylase [Helicobacter sp.]|uniref:phosphorylase family protein n=1 Tax=Helicobacter sp. TaxID=218 RepID=UPI0025BAB71B|nr:purine-nucleoside phosphorylase [Helicobacter sp.]MBR2495366.1 purine-nucleoside phosphorylase [Helicobacter sp.]
MIVCAGRSEIISYAVPIGVGLIEASMGLMRLCLREYVEKLVFVGSAGAYCYEIPLLSLCVSTRAAQIESSFIFRSSYTPLDNYIESNVSQETLQAKARCLRDVIVNSSNYITMDSRICAAMCGVGIMVENMEFFSLLRVAQDFNIPAYGVFCITNYCDTNAQKDFIANHTVAKQKLEAFIQQGNIL